ncbi:folate/biopterin family MFS transporter [Gloeothece verrucosa]|uniref:Folate/biopterin transporter n=1 Tax=Gloeothece verrucosa (strain PCC 7822) TaxID=497965 RepID=E0UIC4_GLOV7|nr:folate/biopterin family MFS transporter [Gloeothece verrucosa]ADN16892.1 folate/biopterin transporter [Gloeothece verrucosa PCC 7822]
MLISPSLKRAFKDSLLFGNEPSLELFAILSVYFVQGILGLARLAVSFFVKDELGLSPAQMAALLGVSALPWVIKPVFGFLSDGLPILGYRRRPYLILSGILGTLSWLALATVVHTTWQTALAILMASLSVAISDVIADSLVVERAREESLGKAGSLQSLMWAVSAMGGLITAYFSGWLLEHFSNREVFAITAIFPLLVTGMAWFILEEKVNSKSSQTQDQSLTLKQQVQQLWGAVTQKVILLPILFIFIWQSTPSADSAFFFFTTNELGFEPEFLGRVNLVTSIASLLGVWIYQRYLKTVSFRVILGWSIVISTVLGMTSLLLVTHANRAIGIDDHWFSIGDSIILSVMGKIAFMPVLVLCARLCPAGIEATMFALLMSISNLSGLVSNELGALLTHLFGVTETNFDKLWLLVLITNLSTLLPLPLINWLPAEDPQAQARQLYTFGPAEAFEHHAPGSTVEQSYIPELVPEFAAEETTP